MLHMSSSIQIKEESDLHVMKWRINLKILNLIVQVRHSDSTSQVALNLLEYFWQSWDKLWVWAVNFSSLLPSCIWVANLSLRTHSSERTSWSCKDTSLIVYFLGFWGSWGFGGLTLSQSLIIFSTTMSSFSTASVSPVPQ